MKILLKRFHLNGQDIEFLLGAQKVITSHIYLKKKMCNPLKTNTAETGRLSVRLACEKDSTDSVKLWFG